MGNPHIGDDKTTSDLAKRLQKLPPELYIMIYDWTFTTPTKGSIRISLHRPTTFPHGRSPRDSGFPFKQLLLNLTQVPRLTKNIPLNLMQVSRSTRAELTAELFDSTIFIFTDVVLCSEWLKKAPHHFRARMQRIRCLKPVHMTAHSGYPRRLWERIGWGAKLNVRFLTIGFPHLKVEYDC